MDERLLAGTVVLALLTITPGADMALVAKVAVSQGRRAAVLASLGVCTGLPVHATASALGIAAILSVSAAALTVVKVVGAAYLVFLGLQASPRSGRQPCSGQSGTSVNSAPVTRVTL